MFTDRLARKSACTKPQFGNTNNTSKAEAGLFGGQAEIMSRMSRRDLLERGVKVSLGAVFVCTAVARRSRAAEKICADPDTMDSGAKGLRASLNYTETYPDPAKSCSVCGFFQGAAGGCGSCMIFNGPANPKGHCDSWSQKS
jgi:hypothetical protein